MFVTVLVVTLAFDQGSKAWARGSLEVHQPEVVIEGFWDWELAYNSGAAFSMFAGQGMQVLLALFAAVALIGIGVIASKTRPEERITRLGLAMIAGGAIGNLIDRLRDGAVTDFIRWRWHEHRWPIFNIADAALLIGLVFLLVDGVSASRRRRGMVAS
ncbi:MAG: signal peptidase II [Deltaproteobacteria bacterium]|nr:signal peptidase II [Deltaproteobacteria bacterium]